MIIYKIIYYVKQFYYANINNVAYGTKPALISLLFQIFNPFILLNLEKLVLYNIHNMNLICKVYYLLIY